MTREAKPAIRQCECDICRTGADPEIVRHHHQMNLFLSRLNEPQRRWYVGLTSQKPGSPSDRELSKVNRVPLMINISAFLEQRVCPPA